MKRLTPEIDQAYRFCLKQARSHYENFPVASVLLPARLRRPVAAIYCFARRADDLADEGSLPRQQRLSGLDDLARRLDDAAHDEPDADPVFIALGHAIRQFDLPLQPFHDLLTAFRQDVDQRRYESFPDLLQYCRCSANPVGRLLLHLGGQAEPRNLALSDAVCTSLQLINFYQDLYQDFHEMGRIYIPLDEMRRFGVTDAHFRDRITDPGFIRLMHLQYERVDRLLRSGAPLGGRLPGRLGLEIRLIINAGARVLWRLRRQREDLFSRPRLGAADYLRIGRDSLWPASGAG